MKQGLFLIRSNLKIACQTWQMRLEGDTSALVLPGQFVNVAVDGFFLRRPFAAREWDAEGFDFIYKTVGEGTEALSLMKPGQTLDVLTGLGNGFNAEVCRSDALLVSGGLGASPLFPLAKRLIAEGRKVTAILAFNTAADIILRKEYEDLGAGVRLVTMDGSAGMQGLVTDAIKALNPKYDFFYTCGPKVMMKAVCKLLEGPGQASLEERMGCGCGICYGCTCHTKNGPARVCADGPVFNREDVIW